MPPEPLKPATSPLGDTATGVTLMELDDFPGWREVRSYMEQPLEQNTDGTEKGK
ncbi:MAG: hypothetical protein JNK54_01210 [Elusimicrobia bacterium]|jgi:hypothetical protein|nr:hypothetical protein [Elusimicrobiota bacterium]